MLNAITQKFHWSQFALLTAGLAWLARAVIALYKPDYWSPRTPLDYAAVVGTSVALILTAVGVWGFYQHHPAPPSRAQTAWRIRVVAICVSALTVGISNFIEDVLNVKGLGYVWAFGILTLTAGLLIAGVSAFWGQGFSRWVGVLFIVCALGLLFIESNGWFGLGLALLTLSLLKPELALGLYAHQLGGLAFAFGNALFVVNKLNEMSRLFLGRPMRDVISGQNPGLILLGQAALILGYIAYFQFYAPRASGRGRNALRLLSGGGIMLAIAHLGFVSGLTVYVPVAARPYVESLFLLVILGLTLLLAGLIWFGIINLRQPLVSRWRWLPLFTGLMGFIGFFLFSGENITATFLVFRTLFACGLIGLGVSLWLEKPAPLAVAP